MRSDDKVLRPTEGRFRWAGRWYRHPHGYMYAVPLSVVHTSEISWNPLNDDFESVPVEPSEVEDKLKWPWLIMKLDNQRPSQPAWAPSTDLRERYWGMDVTTNVETVQGNQRLSSIGRPIPPGTRQGAIKSAVGFPIHRRFANLNLNRESILEFANAYGLLGNRNYILDFGRFPRFGGESLLDWAREIFVVNRITKLWDWIQLNDTDSIQHWIEEYPTQINYNDYDYPDTTYRFIRPEFWTLVGDEFALNHFGSQSGLNLQVPVAPLVDPPPIGIREFEVRSAPLGVPHLEWFRDEARVDCRQFAHLVVTELLSAGMLRGTTNTVQLPSALNRYGTIVPIAKNLLGLIYVSLANEILSGRIVRKICLCGEPIDDGPAESGRFPRHDKVYCSQRCKVYYNRKRKRDLKLLAESDSGSSP